MSAVETVQRCEYAVVWRQHGDKHPRNVVYRSEEKARRRMERLAARRDVVCAPRLERRTVGAWEAVDGNA